MAKQDKNKPQTDRGQSKNLNTPSAQQTNKATASGNNPEGGDITEQASNKTDRGFATFGKTDTGSITGASSDSTSGNMAGSSTDSGGSNTELVSREDSQKGRGYDENPHRYVDEVRDHRASSDQGFRQPDYQDQRNTHQFGRNQEHEYKQQPDYNQGSGHGRGGFQDQGYGYGQNEHQFQGQQERSGADWNGNQRQQVQSFGRDENWVYSTSNFPQDQGINRGGNSAGNHDQHYAGQRNQQWQGGDLHRDHNLDQYVGNQQSGHWDESYESRKRHAMWGNRNNPDERNSRSNQENRYGNQGWQGNQQGQRNHYNAARSGWNQGQGSNQHQQQQDWQAEQRFYQAGGVYHASGNNNQQHSEQQGNAGSWGQHQSMGDHDRNRNNQNERNSGNSSGHNYGAGSYAGELNRDYGGLRYDTDNAGTTAYNRYYEMGSYDRDHTPDRDRGRDSGRNQDYGSGNYNRSNRGESFDFNRSRDQYSGGQGDYRRENYQDHDRGNYNQERNDNRGYRQQGGTSQGYGSTEGRPGYGHSFPEHTGQGAQYQNRDRADSGRDYYSNSRPVFQKQWGSSGRNTGTGLWNSGYDTNTSNYPGSGSNVADNNYGREDDRSYYWEREVAYHQRLDRERNQGRHGDEGDQGFIEKATERIGQATEQLRSWFGGNDDDRNNR